MGASNRAIFCAVLVFVFTHLGSGQQRSGEPEPTIVPKILGDLLFVNAQIDESPEEYLFLVDSGAPETVIDTDVFDKLKTKRETWPWVQTLPFVSGASASSIKKILGCIFSVSGVMMGETDVVVLSSSQKTRQLIGAILPPGQKVVGILGVDLLYQSKMVFDRSTVVFHPKIKVVPPPKRLIVEFGGIAGQITGIVDTGSTEAVVAFGGRSSSFAVESISNRLFVNDDDSPFLFITLYDATNPQDKRKRPIVMSYFGTKGSNDEPQVFAGLPYLCARGTSIDYQSGLLEFSRDYQATDSPPNCFAWESIDFESRLVFTGVPIGSVLSRWGVVAGDMLMSVDGFDALGDKGKVKLANGLIYGTIGKIEVNRNGILTTLVVK